jgi:hypothetical protein
MLTAFLLLVPAIVPSEGGKQWGPRYLLITVPMIAVLAGAQLRRIDGAVGRVAAVTAVLAAIGWGTYVNGVDGARRLAVDYRDRVAPALDVVSSDPAQLVAVSDQFIGMELAAAWDEKRFFLTPSGAELVRLATAAVTHGHDRFLFLAVEPLPGAWRWAGDGGTIELRMTSLGQRGDYFVHQATIRRLSAPKP